MSIQIGAQLYTVCKYCQTLESFADTLARVAEIGYKTVQVSGCCAYDPHWLKEQLDRNGLTCELTHPDTADIANKSAQLMADQAIYNCQYIGIGFLPPQHRGTAAKVRNFVGQFVDASRTIRDLGGKLMYHNHWFEYDMNDEGQNYMEMIYDMFPASDLGFTLDTYWVAYAGYDVLSEIERLSGRLQRAHLKDMEILADGTRRYAPVGYGVLDFEKILPAFEKAGTEVAFVEQDECFERDPFDCLKMSYDYLKSIGYN